jgi:hypothetical protein
MEEKKKESLLIVHGFLAGMCNGIGLLCTIDASEDLAGLHRERWFTMGIFFFLLAFVFAMFARRIRKK